jgi:hypothetical protein
MSLLESSPSHASSSVTCSFQLPAGGFQATCFAVAGGLVAPGWSPLLRDLLLVELGVICVCVGIGILVGLCLHESA